MKKNIGAVVILVLFFLSPVNAFPVNQINSEGDIDTLYYLPDSSHFVPVYAIAGEIYGIHTRFSPENGWTNYKIREVHYLLGHDSVGRVIDTISFYKDTISNKVYSYGANITLTANDLYPNWFKVTMPETIPVMTGVIEVLVYPVGALTCITDPAYFSGNTLGFMEAGQVWGVVPDRPVKLIIEKVPTAVKDEDASPDDFYLAQNYPNPFNPATNISFNIISPGKVTLKVYDQLGVEVLQLLNEEKSAGEYNLNVKMPDNLSSGVYYYQLKSSSQTKTLKMLYLK